MIHGHRCPWGWRIGRSGMFCQSEIGKKFVLLWDTQISMLFSPAVAFLCSGVPGIQTYNFRNWIPWSCQRTVVFCAIKDGRQDSRVVHPVKGNWGPSGASGQNDVLAGAPAREPATGAPAAACAGTPSPSGSWRRHRLEGSGPQRSGNSIAGSTGQPGAFFLRSSHGLPELVSGATLFSLPSSPLSDYHMFWLRSI